MRGGPSNRYEPLALMCCTSGISSRIARMLMPQNSTDVSRDAAALEYARGSGICSAGSATRVVHG